MEDTLEYYLITDFNEEVLNGIDRAEDIPMSNVIAHYEELLCYFDSISDEEQPKLHKRLEDLGLF